jgi:hypothetical protein
VLQPSSLKRNLIPIFTKGGEAQKMMQSDSMSKTKEWNLETIEKREVFPVFHAASLFEDRSISASVMRRFLTVLLV